MPVLNQSDVALNYQVIGPALVPAPPPVALIHGLGANLAFWYLGALRHLGRERTYLLHDLRGHGASSMSAQGYGLGQMAEDFRRLLDHLGIARAHVVGHSHGARVALVFALTYPERVESLTLADTQIRALQPPMRLGDWPHWQDWKADLTTRGVTRFPPEDAVIDFRLLAELGLRSTQSRPAGSDTPGPAPAPRLRQTAHGSGFADTPFDAISAGQNAGRRIDLQSRQMGARGAQRWQALMETTQAPQEMQDESRIVLQDLPGLTMPVLLIFGQLSHCVPTAERLAQILPNARLMLVPGGGHFFPIVKPRLFARALHVFLARVGTQPATPTATPASALETVSPQAALPQPGLARRRGPGLAVRVAHLARGGR